MQQCTRDLSTGDCSECLVDLIGQIPTCCSGKRGGRVIGGSCFMRFEIYPFLNESIGSPTLSPPPPGTLPPAGAPSTLEQPPAAKENKKNNSTIIIATTVPITAVAVFIAFLALCYRRKKQKYPVSSRIMEDPCDERDSLIVTLEGLKLATSNFSDENKLGEGGFGKVYKGTLKNGQMIAVKRLMNSGESLEEFKNEVELVAKLQHRNLVRLMGYCVEGDEKIIVYEYLPNKSLDYYLFDSSKSKLLTWETRVKIIEGISRGLLYLHEDSRFKIVHRDLKASNILLDENMAPKIGDFGIAKLFGTQQSCGNTQRIAGTYGYMAPEYVMHGQISTKSDVYSFGVLLLEIITGKKSTGFHGSDPPTDFISYILRLWKEDNPLQFLDKGIADDCPEEEALKCFHVGLLCTQLKPQDRPNMNVVALFLGSSSVSLPSVASSETTMKFSKLYCGSLHMSTPSTSSIPFDVDGKSTSGGTTFVLR